jgi:hypothetical protein
VEKRPKQRPIPLPSSIISATEQIEAIAQAVKRPIAVDVCQDMEGLDVGGGVLSVLIGWGWPPSKIRAALKWRATVSSRPIAELQHRGSLAHRPACSVAPQCLLDAGSADWRHVVGGDVTKSSADGRRTRSVYFCLLRGQTQAHPLCVM